MTVYYADTFEVPLPSGHKFPMEKYRLLREALLSAGLLGRDELFLSRLATRKQLEAVHSPIYIQQFLKGSLDAKMIRRIGLPWSPQFVQRTLASLGGTIQATQTAWHSGFSANLAGGTHHAFRDAGEGFCVFNDIAVALTLFLRERKVRRAAIIDLDVHQGNGTAAIFSSSERVYTLSIHGARNYPLRKVPSSSDVALPDNCRDTEYLEVLAQELNKVERFGPEFLFYQAGVDVIEQDHLGRLALSLAGVAERDRLVFELACKLAVPLVMTLGGGYARPIDATVQAHCAAYRVAREFFH